MRLKLFFKLNTVYLINYTKCNLILRSMIDVNRLFNFFNCVFRCQWYYCKLFFYFRVCQHYNFRYFPNRNFSLETYRYRVYCGNLRRLNGNKPRNQWEVTISSYCINIILCTLNADHQLLAIILCIMHSFT